MRIGILTVMVLSLFVLIGCATAPKKPVTIEKGIDEHTKKYISVFIQQEMEKHHVQGLSMAMVDDQQIIWAQGFGYADVAQKVPAAPETVSPAGSIAKLFTMIAALQLAEQGKIGLDQPLQIYLPQFSIKTRFPDGDPITPRNIMTHHSGLPSDRLKGIMSRHPIPFTDVMREIKDEYVAYPPNFIFSYSNLSMRWLGAMVEKVSGQAKVKQLEGLKFSLMRMVGRDVLVLHDHGKKHLLGEKIEPGPIPDAWLKRVGDYELVNPGDYFPMIERAQLKFEDHLMILDVTTAILANLGIERLRLAIGPFSNTEAIILGLGRNMGETIQAVTENGEERLRYSGCEFRKKSE
jgi:hypothetical protein